MKNNAFNILTLILALLASGTSLWAQDKYVAAAQIHISITHQLWPDVYINGRKVVDSAAHLFDSKSNITQDLSTAELCYFEKNNCLGVEVDQTLGTSANTNATIGVAYVLRITYSDNTTLYVTSDQSAAKFVRVKKGAPEPPGWAGAGMDDSSWAAVTPFIPTSMAVTLINPETNMVAKYFPTYKDDGDLYGALGDRFYFRQQFTMEVITPPGCVPKRENPPTKTPTPNHPTATSTPLPPQPTFTPRPTRTPRPRPTSTPVPPTATWTPRLPRPTSTPLPVATEPSLPTATPRPKPKPRPTRTPRPLPPTATPEIYVPQNTATEPPLPTSTRTPVRRPRRPTATPTRIAMATATFTAIPQQDMGMAATIVFVNPPVNIDASFADGPGRYKLEIVDAQENHLVTLYDKHVSFEKESWISWDGTNDQGQLMHYGQYYALFSKDGRLIQKIALNWIPPNQSTNP